MWNSRKRGEFVWRKWEAVMGLAKRAGRKIITASQPVLCKVFLVMKESRRFGRPI